MRRHRGICLWFARAAFLIAFIPLAAQSADLPKVAALPTAVAPPANAGKGIPFDGNPLITMSGASIDLDALGYVEEEFFVTGTANVYQYGSAGVEIKTAAQPYTTRILIYRPRDARRFSGTVHVDVAPPGVGGNTFGWSADYILNNGHAFVTIATRRGGGADGSGIDRIKAFDPVRYAPMNFTEDGLTWDIMSQVGSLLKTKTPLNPLNALDVKRLYAQGWSGSGALLLFYISDGFHGRVRMADGSPIYNGYLVGEPSGYPRINSTATPIPENDPRQTVLPRDVPAITLHTGPQPANRRRPDGDARDDRYRVYEVAGAEHGQLRLAKAYNQRDSSFDVGSPIGCAHEISRFPFHFYYQSTLARVAAWAERGVTPPPTQRIAVGPDGAPQRDEHGNIMGGVRSTYLDVPAAQYFTNATKPGGNDPNAPMASGPCRGMGAEATFARDKLRALYRNHITYVTNADQRARELEREGWLLPFNTQQIREEAQHFAGFFQ